MGISSAMNAGVMGLSVNSSKLATISDNIANSETKGYKRASIEFNSLVLTERPTTYDAGGVRASTVREIDDQGALLSTRNTTDLAISGRGFLPVTDIADVNRNATDLPLKLLRTGAFRPDQNGVMQTQSGLVLMGWAAAGDGSFSDLASGLEPVRLDSLSLAAEATTKIDVKANLNADALPTDKPFPVDVEYFDTLGKSRDIRLQFEQVGVENKWNMYVFEETAFNTAGDRVGPPSLAYQIEFETQADNNPGGIKSVEEYDAANIDLAGYNDGLFNRDYRLFNDGAATPLMTDKDGVVLQYDDGGGVDVDLPVSAVGSVRFDGVLLDGSGNPIQTAAGVDVMAGSRADSAATGVTQVDVVSDLVGSNLVTDNADYTWQWNAPAGSEERGVLSYNFNNGAEIEMTLGAAGEDGNIVQYSADSQRLSITTDGSPTSTLTGIEIDETGLMDAIYDTGFRKTLYKIPVANVQNPNGMRTQDGQAFSLTRESGSVYFYDAGEGPTGALVSSALEESTTDVAEELTQLIKTQRAYSSNAKIIQTVDEMLQETTNLKR